MSGFARRFADAADVSASIASSQTAQDAALLAADGAGVGAKYAAVGAVALNLKSYAEDDGAYSLMGFVAEADKAAIRNGSSVVDQSAAISSWLTAAYVESMRGGYVPRGVYPVIAGATLTMTANRITQGMTIRGAGRYGSRIVKLSGVGAPLTITSANPAVSHTDAQLVIADLGFVGAAKGSHGLRLLGVANFTLERITVRGFDRGLDLQSSLVGALQGCDVSDNNIGLITRRIGPTYCNALRIEGGRIVYNSERGLDIGDGQGVWIGGGIDIERNGTAANVATGGLIVRSTVDDEIGYALISIGDAWFEANYGHTIDVEATPNLFLSMHDMEIVSPESGRALRVAGARSVTFKDSFALGNSATLNITADKFSMENALADVVTDNATFSVYSNSATSTAEYVSGKTGSMELTLTGCGTVPTGIATWTRQGKTITLNLPDITGPSSSAAATLTGLAPVLYPSAPRVVLGTCRDNGVEKLSPIGISAAGVITLNNGYSGAFTPSGVKGVSAVTVTYEQ